MSAATPCIATLSLLGLAVRFESDSAELLGAALRSYAPWLDQPVPANGRQLRLRLDLDVHNRAGSTAFAATGAHGGGREWISDVAIDSEPLPLPGFAAPVVGARLELHGAGAVGSSDASAGEAQARIAADLLTEGDALADVLDTLLLFLLTRAGRVPLHAAGCLAGEKAMLLVGRSGAGKSTLAWQADQAGLAVLAEDTVYLEGGATPRVWGFPRSFHLAAPSSLPAGDRSLRLRAGRLKERIEPSRRPPLLATGDAVLYVLERGARAELQPLSPEAAIAKVMSALEPGFEHFRAVLPDVLHPFTRAGAWCLTVGPDPAESFALLSRAHLAASD